MSTTPVTPTDAVAALRGNVTKIATDAATAYANFAPEAQADFHAAIDSLEAVYGALVGPLRSLFPKPANPPAPSASAATK